MDAENNLVEEEASESPPQLDNNNGGMDTIRMVMECLSRYDNLEDEDSGIAFQQTMGRNMTQSHAWKGTTRQM